MEISPLTPLTTLSNCFTHLSACKTQAAACHRRNMPSSSKIVQALAETVGRQRQSIVVVSRHSLTRGITLEASWRPTSARSFHSIVGDKMVSGMREDRGQGWSSASPGSQPLQSRHTAKTFLKSSSLGGKRSFSSDSKRDFYEILGVNRNADKAAIKKAYFKLAKKYHPDTNKVCRINMHFMMALVRLH